MTGTADPHGNEPVLRAGPPLAEARAAMLLAHGRGAGAASILSLAGPLELPDVSFLAPQAARSTWYPHSFLVPREQNEPYLSSALRRLAQVVADVEDGGIPAERIFLLGFSQGGCLSLEFGARHPRRYGGIIGLSGGLIGPPGSEFDYPGSFEGTPIFLGSSDPDPHIPVERVRESEQVLERMGARVTMRIYPGLGHTVNQEEIDAARAMVLEAIGGAG